MGGQFTAAGGLNGHSRTVQMNSLSGGTAELDDMEECAAFGANHRSCNIVFLSYILEGLF